MGLAGFFASCMALGRASARLVCWLKRGFTQDVKGIHTGIAVLCDDLAPLIEILMRFE